jgi:excisionase family DNA binding protein
MDTQLENAWVAIPISGEIRVPSSVFVALAKHIELECTARARRHGTPPKMFETDSGLQRLAFSVKETAEILGVSTPTIYRLISRQVLKPSRALRHKLIPRSEIERFLRQTTALEA